MQSRAIWYVLLVAALFVCAACADQTAPAQPPQSAQLPTAVAIKPTAMPATSVAQPTAVSQSASEPLPYVWPTYLPDGMHLSPPESHVANPDEIGSSGLGFFVMVLNGNNQKLSIGGGEIHDTIPISGDERNITAGKLSGKLITSGVYREIIFDVPRGKLFVYSTGLSETELLKVADSLQSVDLPTLRGKLEN